MTAPTLYYLIFKLNRFGDVYHIYEQHQCQEKGCFKTDEEYIRSIQVSQKDEFINEFEEKLARWGAELDGVEVIEEVIE